MCQILLRIQIETKRAHWIKKKKKSKKLFEVMCRNTAAYGGKNGKVEVNTALSGGCV